VKNYYVALGLNFRGEEEFPAKKFFWCSSGNFIFAELPECNSNQDIKSRLEGMSTLFTGEFDKILIDAAETGEVGRVIGNEDDEDMIRLPPKHITGF
jgi:radial spoke head protein 9